ncbi:hypothetical protein D052_1750 [Vibrio parahaemolyticus 10290]|nr:hypothetical protein D052_1750 [Vibrio parahaemolyticus 10290]
MVNIPIYKELIGIFSKLDEVKIGFIITIPIFFFARLISYSTFSWPWVGKPFFILAASGLCLVSYAGYNYGTLFDSGMIANIVETDSSEASSYLSTYSVVWRR